MLALAIQFLLSFGHFHGDSASAASVSTGAMRAGLHHGLAVGQASASHRASQADILRPKILVPIRPKTSDHLPAGQPCDDCAICAIMALANAMVDAAPPLLLSPHATAFSYLVADARFAEPNSARVAFQPRAPPIA